MYPRRSHAWRPSLLELHAGTERWESYSSDDEKKLKDTKDDEIKLAFVPEELEKHMIFNSNRLRTFEDAAPWNREAGGGEVWFENPRFQTK